MTANELGFFKRVRTTLLAQMDFLSCTKGKAWVKTRRPSLTISQLPAARVLSEIFADRQEREVQLVNKEEVFH